MRIETLHNPEEYLHETGLLYEINRMILHPLGLVLSITEQEMDDTTIMSFVLQETTNPNGFTFSAEDLRNAKSRYDAFLTERKPRVLTRGKNLGYIQQPTK